MVEHLFGIARSICPDFSLLEFQFIVPKIKTRGFFYTTELVYYAEPIGDGVIEVPAIIEPSQLVAGTTSVRPLKHGTAMLKQLVALRRRGRE